MFNANTANAYVIEVHGIAAGLIVRGERGRSYRFVADDPRFSLLDGQYYVSPEAAQASAERQFHAAAPSAGGEVFSPVRSGRPVILPFPAVPTVARRR